MASKTTTEKGLGWRHQQAVEDLKRKHKDGSPCDWCGREMFLDRTRNWDYSPGVRASGSLQGDHSKMSRSEAIRRGEKILPPDRLLHGECNRSRGVGGNDHLAAENRVFHSVTEHVYAMPWPWTTGE
jgi:hypothetical protein